LYVLGSLLSIQLYLANVEQAAAEKEALKQAEIQARARAKAHIKFDEPAKNADIRSKLQKRQPEEDEAGVAENNSSSDSDSPSENGEDVQFDPKTTKPPHKKRKTIKTAVSDQTSTPTSGMTSGASSSAEKSKKSKGKGKSAKQQKKPMKNKGKGT
jgi:exosome complex protein LRP1